MTQVTWLAHVIAIVAISVFCGVVSGVTAALWGNVGSLKERLQKYIMLGIVAAGTVPAFLATIGSKYIDLAGTAPALTIDVTNYLKYAGLCLVASFFGGTYLPGLADRVFGDLKKTQRIARVAQANATLALAAMDPTKYEPEGDDEVESDN